MSNCRLQFGIQSLWTPTSKTETFALIVWREGKKSNEIDLDLIDELKLNEMDCQIFKSAQIEKQAHIFANLGNVKGSLADLKPILSKLNGKTIAELKKCWHDASKNIFELIHNLKDVEIPQHKTYAYMS